MPVVVGILSIVSEAGACLCLGMVFGFASAAIYQNTWLVLQGSQLSKYLAFGRVAIGLSGSFGGCLGAWIFMQGPTLIFLPAALLGWSAGALAGFKNAEWYTFPRRSIKVGLCLCTFDYLILAIGNQLEMPFLVPLLTGLLFTLLSFVAFLILVGITKLLRPVLNKYDLINWCKKVFDQMVIAFFRTSSTKPTIKREPTMTRGNAPLLDYRWPFHIAVISSLGLTAAGGLFLMIVLPFSVVFGYSCSARYLGDPGTYSAKKTLWSGFLALAFAHTLFSASFYGIASYNIGLSSGILSIAAAPYALGGILLGISMHRVHAFKATDTQPSTRSPKKIATMRKKLKKAAAYVFVFVLTPVFYCSVAAFILSPMTGKPAPVIQPLIDWCYGDPTRLLISVVVLICVAMLGGLAFKEALVNLFL
ncbi:MAG: hypothetical protein KKA73_07705 [Chloroflexi bacterium]|nr:hypothetical protein [Chloroflexota bacterium]